MNKNLRKLILVAVVCSVSFSSIIGCGKDNKEGASDNAKPQVIADKNYSEKGKGGFVRGERPDAKKLIEDITTEDDKLRGFKIEKTNEFLGKLYSIQDLLTDDFEYSDKPTGMNKVKTQLQYENCFTQYDRFDYKSNSEEYAHITAENNIAEIYVDLFFDDEEGTQALMEDYSIVLNDVTMSGSLKINKQMEDILKVMYKDIDISKLQECIDKEYENGINNSFDAVTYKGADNNTRIYLSNYFNDEHKAREVTINISRIQEYPQQ